MPQANISLETQGTEEMRRFIDDIKTNMDNGQRFLSSVFSVFGFKDIVDHFKDESGSNGPWPKRSPTTNKMYDDISSGRRSPPRGSSKASFNSSNKILQLTGALRQSLERKSGNNAIRTKGKNTIEIFSSVQYSGKHDVGDPKKNLPERNFMWLSRSAMDKMLDSFLALVTGDKR